MVGTLAKSDPLGLTHIGKYQLVRRLATGGMAEIFLARARSMQGFEKLVVLKRILPQHADSDDFIQMFLAEARLAATLHHPNIVQVYDIGQAHGAFFFTMEYVQGQDLRTLVRSARKAHRSIPIEHILHIVMGVAGGLHHAHEQVGSDGRPLGIVHRDVSPSNVLVTYAGDVKIVDFGIAKAASAQVATIAGTLKGKIPYMSPEQCRGEPVDRRSDIFSIGTLLWELTTGRRLFAGDNEFAVLNQVAKGIVPRPSTVRADYPAALEAIVMKALCATPGGRYDDSLQMQMDLEDFAREYRLPVSSARMGIFMGELFAEERRTAQLELARDEHDDASHEYTPSDQIRSANDTVPGRREGARTTVELAVPSVWRRVALGLGATLVVALGVSGAYVGLQGVPSWAQEAALPTRTHAPTDVSHPTVAGPPSPSLPIVPLEAPEPQPVAPSPSGPTAVDLDDAPATKRADDPAAKPPKSTTRREPSGSVSRPSRRTPSSRKTEYDPDSALPPGV